MRPPEADPQWKGGINAALTLCVYEGAKMRSEEHKRFTEIFCKSSLRGGGGGSVRP